MKKIIFAVSVLSVFMIQACYAAITGNYYEYHSQKELVMEGKSDGVVVQLRDKNYPLMLFVDNKGQEPIEFNYLADKCYYITVDGKKYLLPLTRGNEPYYSDGGAILNPGRRTTMMFDRGFPDHPEIRDMHNDFCDKVKEGKVKEILLEINYGKTKIRLLPVNSK